MNKIEAFEIDNAKNLTFEAIAGTFVPIDQYWRLISGKNHIILGSRGSGKTTLMKMLSYPSMISSKDQNIKSKALSNEYIGLYLPTNTEWVGSLKNKNWQTNREKENNFLWKINLASCVSLIEVLKSFVAHSFVDKNQQLLTEIDLCRILSNQWFEYEYVRFKELKNILLNVANKKEEWFIKKKYGIKNIEPIGTTFELPIFNVVKESIRLISEKLNLENTKWYICLDEAENLDDSFQAILNTYLRSSHDNFFLKIATTPYHHLTHRTNIDENVYCLHDFEYVYIDVEHKHPLMGKYEKIADEIFSTRCAYYGLNTDLTLEEILGKSPLLDNQPWTSEDSIRLNTYCTNETINRANTLFKEKKDQEFLDQIGRKIRGALQLKQEFQNHKGHRQSQIYSGRKLFIRCSDFNPRRLIRLYNLIISEIKYGEDETKKIEPGKQHELLVEFSNRELMNIKSSEGLGFDLYTFLDTIGNGLHYLFHEKKISTDFYYSIKFTEENQSKNKWQLIKRAVSIGLLFPDIQTPDVLPIFAGTFHFSFVLAPKYFLLPRRGSTINYSKILSYLDSSPEQFILPLED
ncbi:MAG: hypothetical protein ACOWWR_16555 [Eubacteriales bacterium]